MSVSDTLDVLWVLKVCIWCNKHILPDDLAHTTDKGSGNVYFQHRDGCPVIDPLALPA